MAAATIDAGASQDDEPGHGRELLRRYPPLLFLVTALAFSLLLPSALTLPQANPAQTVEIAPVPPDDSPPQQQSNLDQLNVAGSESLDGGSGASGGAGTGGDPEVPGATIPGPLDPGAPPPIADIPGQGKTPVTKRCVKDSEGVLRQTEDPLSPPCVANFTGDNGGATYQGISGDEIKIVVYDDGGITSTPTPRGQDTGPTDTLKDMDSPASTPDHFLEISMRGWQRYFNERYQLYGRRAHFFIYYGGSDRTQQGRQADAAAVYAQLKPFAAISLANFSGGADSFIRYLAQRNVLNFGSAQGRAGSFFQEYPARIWGYPPSLEQQAENWVTAVCTKFQPYPSGFAGTSDGEALNGKPRKFGLLTTSDPNYPSLAQFRTVVKLRLKAVCGLEPAVEKTYPVNNFAADGGTSPQTAINNMAAFKQAGVTTILWPGGSEPQHSNAAESLGYLPEWILAGDGSSDATSYAVRQNKAAWAHAVVVTFQVKVLADNTQQVCYQAFREADTTAQDQDAQSACGVYNDLRQLITGIQVAGPKLGPSSIDRGFHAIPQIASKDPRLPACFYDPGDYTCVKDGVIEWFNPNGAAGDQFSGCWMMVQGGKRSITGKWSVGRYEADINPSTDFCNTYSINYNIQ